MSYAQVAAKLAQGKTVILDGGTGTELERRGVTMNPDAWCGVVPLADTPTLIQIHEEYINAGAEVITANTYASSRLMLTPAGFADQVEAINKNAVQAAFEAREQTGRPDVVVAGSLSHMVPMQAGSSQVDRSRNPSQSELLEAFSELATLHKDNGCDLIIMEMMFHPERMPLALEAATQAGLPVWVGMSGRRGPAGEVLSFTEEADIPFAEIVAMISGFDVAAAGVMHSNVGITGPAIDIVKANFDGPLMAYPDSGYFKMPDWQFEDIIPPTEFATCVSDWKQQGAQIVGGCCGLSPEHIAAIAPG